jgi:uncharacterized repeat protein (TIGR03806 family)
MTRHTGWSVLGSLFLLATLAPGCDRPPGGGSPDGGVPSPFGLDERPTNTTCLAPPRPTIETTVALTPVYAALSFNKPVLLLQAPGDASRWFVVEQGGAVRTFANDPNVTASTPFIDITTRVNSGAGAEAGLLGMAFHPNFATNGQVFLSYTGYGGPTNLRSVIARFRSNDGGRTLDPASEEILLTVDQPYTNHNGGNVAFGPDGYLYIGLGDGGSGGDPQGNGQNTSTLLGKMLRIDVDTVQGAQGYGIPADNPFAGGGGRPEIYAVGLRNPWRWSFDRATGELWAGDVGQTRLEEIDRIERGGNYGWNVREGTQCYRPSTGCPSAGLIDPVVEYGRTDGASVTGGFVYRGSAIPSLVGAYVYGDFVSGRIWRITYDPMTGRPSPQLLLDTSYNISSFGEGQDGELYVVSYGGRIYQFTQASTPPATNFPARLSETGCVDPRDATRPAAGLIPYDVNVELWSDGAEKRRWLALPTGARIHINDDGDWDLPIGTVLVKEFRIGGQRIETRLLVRHDDGGWAGYSYEWNDAQTEATLLPAGKTRAVGAGGTQRWSYPSRPQCQSCHNTAAGGTLGLETAQLNREIVYPTGRRSSQLATLDHIGLFDTPLAAAPGALPSYPPPSSTAPVDERARAYLHANCAQCHRPGGPGQGPLDLRYTTALAAANLCDQAPENGDLGVSGAVLLAPGEPARSILSLRPRALDTTRMPPLASSIVDAEGTALIDSWITGLSACPSAP